MSTFRIANGIKYNPANWAGLAPSERAACARFAAARERELNTITATPHQAHGGPFAGSVLELESSTDRTAPMAVGAWAGHYELHTDPEHIKTHGRPYIPSAAPRVLMWVGNDGGKPINTHGTTTSSKAAPEVNGKGFDQLRDLLADLAGDPSERATSSPIGPRATYTIGRTTFTIAANAESADRLTARILKAKRWFSDKLLTVAAPVPAAAVLPETPLPLHDAHVWAFYAHQCAQVGRVDPAPTAPAIEAPAPQAMAPAADELASVDLPDAALDAHIEAMQAPAPTPSAYVATPLERLTIEELLESGDHEALAFALNTRSMGDQATFESLTGIKAGSTIASRKQAAMRYFGEKKQEAAIVAAALAIGTAQASSAQADQMAAADTDSEDTSELATCEAIAPQAQAAASANTDTTQASASPAGSSTAPACPLRTAYHRASDAGHVQHSASKAGAWRAAAFKTENGRAGLFFSGPAGIAEFSDYETPGQRVRALQAMARAADLASAPTPGVGGVAGSIFKPAAPTLSITLDRWEGPSDECTGPVTLATFAQADALLMRWSDTAPQSGGYDKTGYVVTWPNGETTSGRLDLVHHSITKPSLRDEIASSAEYVTGKFCPMHMGHSEYDAAIERIASDEKAQQAAILELLATHAGYFPRQHPASCDSLELLMQRTGIACADLVGLGVASYSSDTGLTLVGAITSAAHVTAAYSSRSALVLSVTYENGTTRSMDATSFADRNGYRCERHRLDMRRHGAPYLAQLAAATISAKAAASSAAERAAQARAQRRAELLAQYAHLKTHQKAQEEGGKLSGCTLAAHNMRVLLKGAFPGVKFSVKCSQYSMGNNIKVSWIDGPTDEAVSAITGMFSGGNFDGSTDCYEYSNNAFGDLFGSGRYISTRRELSDEAITVLIAQAYPDKASRPTLAQHYNGDLRDEFGREAVYIASQTWTAPSNTRKV